YIAKSIWPEVKEQLINDTNSFKMGSPEYMSKCITAVIDEKSFDNLASYIDQAKKDDNAEIIAGGGYDKSEGYFVEPTVIVKKDPKYETMCTELFGPVLTIYVFDDNKWEETLELTNNTSDYGLNGDIFSNDSYELETSIKTLEKAAGNF